MKIKLYLLAFFACLFTNACAKHETGVFPAGQGIDLSYDFSSATIYWAIVENGVLKL